jgi:hypothetical protein
VPVGHEPQRASPKLLSQGLPVCGDYAFTVFERVFKEFGMLSVSNLRFSIGTKIDWVWPCIDDVETRSNAVVRALIGRKRAYFNRIHGASPNLAMAIWRSAPSAAFAGD